MTDETAGTGLAGARGWRGWRVVPDTPFSPPLAFGLMGLVAATLFSYFWHREGTWQNIVFTIGITTAVAGTLALVTRRLMFSVATTGLLCAIIIAAASVKRQTMNMVVHAYDLFFYLSSWSTISFLAGEYPALLARAAALVMFAALAAVMLYRLDPTRLTRRSASALLLAGIAIGTTGATIKEERRHMQFYFENLYVSSFYASWGETLSTLWHGTMLEAAPSTEMAPLAMPTSCRTAEKPPHIVLIHQESIVPPSLFPTLTYDRSVDPMFRSQDGAMRKLRVETYGGASWLTEFSILAGVSTQAFGGMRQFVQTFMVNRLSDTLPQRLSQCGYRNVVFYPMLRNFVSNDKFYASVGLNEIFDLKAQGAKSAQERDRFYYGNAIAEMERHVASSDKPLFTYVQTMSAHWPYDVAFAPDVPVAGGGPGTHPEMSEYLRRVSLARMDYDFLLAELKRRLPNERILIVHYGDHHPSATRMLLGFKEDTEVEDVALAEDSLGYTTYFALDGLNYRVSDVTAGVPEREPVDIPYLGMIIQAAARLPLSDANVERRRLMVLCQGRYNTCSRRQEILAFHRRLIDSGIIVAR